MNSAKMAMEVGKVKQLFEEDTRGSRAQIRTAGTPREDDEGDPEHMAALHAGVASAVQGSETGDGHIGGMAGIGRWLQAAKRHAEETQKKIQTSCWQPSPALVVACQEAMQTIAAMVNAEVSAATGADMAQLKKDAVRARQDAERLRKKNAMLARQCEALPDYVGASPGEVPAIAWSQWDIVKLVLGLCLVALLAVTEMLSINQILNDFTRNFGGSGTLMILKRLGVAFLVLGINLALKYSVLMEVKQNPRVEVYARRCAMTVLMLAIITFLGTLVYSGLPSVSGMTLTNVADNSQMVAVLRLVSIFAGSFCAVFALSGAPLAELARHYSARRRNAEKLELEKKIDAIEAEILDLLNFADHAGKIEEQHQESMKRIISKTRLDVVGSIGKASK